MVTILLAVTRAVLVLGWPPSFKGGVTVRASCEDMALNLSVLRMTGAQVHLTKWTMKTQRVYATRSLLTTKHWVLS